MRRGQVVVLLVLAGLLAFGVSGASARTAWLCRPGLAHSICALPLTATVVSADGRTRVERARPARRPSIDCFYVYPTASTQPTLNAELHPDPGVVNTVRSQASRFSQVCRVFAPLYRQVTLVGLGEQGSLTAAQRARAFELAYGGVLGAWRNYLAHYNHGRGVVLIGHSQGSGMLRRLIRTRVDVRRGERRRLVSALLLGGDVVVRPGRGRGGDFRNVSACRSARQLGCVIAFSSFDATPPSNTLFGRPGTILGGPGGSGLEVLCTNPASLGGGSGVLRPYFTVNAAAGLLGGLGPMPRVRTAWVSYPGLFRARCRHARGTTWLQIDRIGGAGERRGRGVQPFLGANWGLHVFDVNLALGNLVSIVRTETAAYEAQTRARGRE